jgi:phosphoglycolate phosphatase
MRPVPPISKHRHPLLIWDIDGTLLPAHGVGRQALNHAFEECYGIAHAFDGLDFAGATDHDLIEQAAAGIPVNLAAFFSCYGLHLERALQNRPLTPLPGVVDLIVHLSRQGWPQVLGSGNIRLGAYLKLGAAGLANYFPDGAFSEPHLTRAAILATAARLHPGSWAVVLGDTPRDIAGAHEVGLKVIAVATGRFSPDELAPYAPDQMLLDLANPDHFLAAVRALG